jgi:hypothetical protein
MEVNRHTFFKTTVAALIMGSAVCGCNTPQTTQTVLKDLDSVEGEGAGVGSYEIRSVASMMAPQILALPEVSRSGMPVRIAVARMKNNSSYPMDMDIFMRRLRAELMEVGGGKVHFFSQENPSVDVQRATISKEQSQTERERMLDSVADAIVNQPVLKTTRVPVVIAIMPPLNVNFVGMNADSFITMLRSRISERGNNNIRFTMPGELKGADFILTGQFIADSMKKEGILNLLDYAQYLEQRVKDGKSVDVYGDLPLTAPRDSILEEIQKNSQLRIAPNVTKKLNVMLVETATQTSVLDRMFDIEREVKTGLGAADYILSGEISSVSKRAQGTEMAYLMVAVQLVNPASNELVWEKVFEIKKETRAGVVY